MDRPKRKYGRRIPKFVSNDRLLSATEASYLLGIHPSTFSAQISRTGALPFMQLGQGRHRLYRLSVVRHAMIYGIPNVLIPHYDPSVVASLAPQRRRAILKRHPPPTHGHCPLDPIPHLLFTRAYVPEPPYTQPSTAP